MSPVAETVTVGGESEPAFAGLTDPSSGETISPSSIPELAPADNALSGLAEPYEAPQYVDSNGNPVPVDLNGFPVDADDSAPRVTRLVLATDP